MKKALVIILLSLTASYACVAQFDEKFYFPSKVWHPMTNSNIEEMDFHLGDDTLHAVLFKSETTPKATIIYYHGTGGNISVNTSVARLLNKEGFYVFMVDFRGYGKSTGTPTHLNIAHDAQAIFDQLIVRADIKDLPIIIYGASIGTQIATKMAKDNSEKVSALILDGCMESFTEMALLSAPEEYKATIAANVTSPYSAFVDVKELGELPKLFIHSRGDRSVPFAQGKAVFTSAPEPKVFWEYEGNHLDASARFPEEYVQRINRLFEEM